MTLEQFLNYYGIRPATLEDIKKRVFIVGRFNTADQEPSAYLFSKSRRPDSRYKASRDLSYASFIDVIRPTLTEYYKKEDIVAGESLPYFELSPQKMDIENGDASYVIDPFNYFFQRAISTTEHPHYKDSGTNKAPMNLLKDTPGETIYKQIRENLKKFCSFQYRNFEIIRAFAKLLHENKGKGGIPTGYADGEQLPVKFIPIFIDFLYQEGTQAFEAELIDFDSHKVWQTAILGSKKEEFIANFQKTVTAFKNYLLSADKNNVENIGDIRLSALPGIVKEDLRKAFVDSREAYNMLRQIIRSKVMLSMVLQWAISYFHTLESVKNVEGSVNKNRAIESAVKNGVPGAVAVPTKKLANDMSVPDLIKDFKVSFPIILEYINKPDNKEKEKAFQNLSPFLQNIGNGILKDETKTSNIRQVLSMEPQQKTATLNAIEIFFVDVLIPRMFKEPGLTLAELNKKYKDFEAELFQVSSMLEVSNNKNVQSILETGKNENSTYEERLGEVVSKMVEFLVHKEVLEGVQRTTQTLLNYNTILLINGPNENRGLGDIVPMLPPSEGITMEAFSKSIVEPVAQSQLANLAIDSDHTKQRVLALYSSEQEAKADQRLLMDGNANKENDQPVQNDSKENLFVALQKYVNNDNKQLSKIELQKEVQEIVSADVKRYHSNLSKIYSRYAEQSQLPVFKNKVEAMTLTQLLLIHKNELHLDKAGTNLYDLLLDLVEKIEDPERPNLEEFFSQHSLTKYISAKHFNHDGAGFGALETILKNQTEESLKNVVQYVSELQGIKYLLDVLNKSQTDCEVIVINAHGNEFLEWIESNMENDAAAHFLNPAGLANKNQIGTAQPQFPIVAFITELAFNKNGWSSILSEKVSFLNQINTFGEGLKHLEVNKAILPPFCISTSVADQKKEWISEGMRLNELCKNTFSPTLILGPSIPLNNTKDTLFKTVLSSGYTFCAHLLTGGKEQGLNLFAINIKPSERFRNIGYGNAGISTTIRNFIEASDMHNETYSFAADFYLYIISLIAGSISSSGHSDPEELKAERISRWEQFYHYFFYYAQHLKSHNDSRILDRVSLYKRMTDWSMTNDISKGDKLDSIRLFNTEKKDKFSEFKNMEWFNNLASVLKISDILVIKESESKN